jgi:hypothetical protein
MGFRLSIASRLQNYENEKAMMRSRISFLFAGVDFSAEIRERDV